MPPSICNSVDPIQISWLSIQKVQSYPEQTVPINISFCPKPKSKVTCTTTERSIYNVLITLSFSACDVDNFWGGEEARKHLQWGADCTHFTSFSRNQTVHHRKYFCYNIQILLNQINCRSYLKCIIYSRLRVKKEVLGEKGYGNMQRTR